MGAGDVGVELAAGAVLVCAVLTLWRRDVAKIVVLLRLQGVALATVAMVLAVREHDGGLVVTAALVLVVKAVVVPGILARVVDRGGESREKAPLVNVPASLVVGAALIVLAYLAGSRIAALAPGPVTDLAPIGFATVLVGYFLLVTRRRAVSQVAGLILVDNGVGLVTFLLTAGVPLVVELGGSLDVLLVVVVLGVLIGATRGHLGEVELDDLRELRD